MSTIESIADKIRSSLVVLNLPIVLEMAIYSGKQSFYSDLSRISMGKIFPFTESFMLLGVGDNLSLSLDERRIIFVSKISAKAVLIVVTNQRIGAILARLKEVIEEHSKELDQILPAQPTPTVPTEEKMIVTEEPTLPIGGAAEEVGAPLEVREKPSVTQEVSPTQTITEAIETAIPTTLPRVPQPPPPKPIGTFMAPVVLDKSILKRSSGDQKKILSLCTGRLSIEEISKKSKIPPKTVIETVYRYMQEGAMELREEKKTGEEEAMSFLKRF